MRKAYFISFLMLFLPLAVIADFDMEKWRFAKNIEPAAGALSERLGAFMVDREVYEKAKSDVSDLRVVDANGEEVSHHIINFWKRDATEQVQATILNNSFVVGREQSLILDFGAGRGVHNQVSLGVSQQDRNFRRKVTVSGSDAVGNWRVLSQENVIYDYSVDISARKTTLYYPLTNFRYLFIQITDEGGGALNITSATGTFIAATGAKDFQQEVRYSGSLSVSEDKTNNTTDVIVDVGQNSIPIHKLVLETPSIDFYRQVKVYGRSDHDAAWKPYVTDVIFRYSDPTFRDTQLTIRSPDIRERYIKVVIVNNDNKPIAVSGVSLFGAAQTVVFPFTAGKTYTLYYGNENARTPQYDLAYILARMRIEEHIVLMQLGEAKVNLFYKEPEKPLPPFTERYPYFLTVSLVILVLLLGALVLKVLIRNQSRT